MPIRSYSYISRLLVAVHPTGISILEILPNALKRVWGFPFRIITMSISFYSNKYSFCLPHSLIEPPPPQKFTIWLPTIIIFLQTNEQYPTWLFLPTPSLSTTKTHGRQPPWLYHPRIQTPPAAFSPMRPTCASSSLGCYYSS